MKRTLIYVTIVLGFSFLWGLWWGYSPDKPLFFSGSDKLSLSVLAPASIFQNELLTELQQVTEFELKVTLKNDTLSLLQEILSSPDKYDLIFFPSYLANSLVGKSIFKKFPDFLIQSALANISVDFLDLPLSEDSEYWCPLFWGVSGWLIPKDKNPLEFSLKDYSALQVPPEPAEIYALSKSLKPLIAAWTANGQVDDLKQDTAFFSRFKFSSTPKALAQITNGQLSESLLTDHQFAIPTEGARIWLIYAGVSNFSPKVKEASRLLQIIVDTDLGLRIAKNHGLASVLRSSVHAKNLPDWLRASYLRSLPLSRLDLFSDHTVYEPVFYQALQKHHPEVFAK